MLSHTDKNRHQRPSVIAPSKPPTPPPALRSIDEYNAKSLTQLGLIGKIPSTAYSLDNRFSSSLYIPLRYSSLQSLRLVVLVHSSDRDASELRSAFIDFAEENDCALLAPLFTQGIIDPDEQDNYKKILYRDIRFDQILLGMVDEMKQRWPKVDTQKLFMTGFSGGGQFVHRFAYLHPDRLQAVVVGAPGSVTHLNLEKDYPQGVRNIQEVFDIRWSPEALKSMRVLMFVGDLDTSVGHLIARGWKPSDCRNRCEVLKGLESSWTSFGISVKFQLIPGVRHEGSKTNKAVQDFFTTELGRLAERRKGAYGYSIVSEEQ